MAWKTADIEEQRVRFVVCASRREKSFQQLCVLVYYCRSLVRELDLLHHRSTAVDRWWL